MSTKILEYLDAFLHFLNQASSDWNKFVSVIKEENRFFPQPNIINYLEKIYKNNTIEIKEGTVFYRARKMDIEKKSDFSYDSDNKKILGFPKNEMGMPPREKVTDGRANPSNIPYLYLASNIKTACAEVRCELYDIISVMNFKLTRDLKVIDLTQYSLEGEQEYSLLFWKLQEAFKKYNNNYDKQFYVPTQYVASFFASKTDINGIIFPTARDASNDSYNLVLFNDKETSQISDNAFVYICSGCSFDLNDITNPDPKELNVCASISNKKDKIITKIRQKIIDGIPKKI